MRACLVLKQLKKSLIFSIDFMPFPKKSDLEKNVVYISKLFSILQFVHPFLVLHNIVFHFETENPLD
jgi:hypothetical protein